jgi:hypothetical protein
MHIADINANRTRNDTAEIMPTPVEISNDELSDNFFVFSTPIPSLLIVHPIRTSVKKYPEQNFFCSGSI